MDLLEILIKKSFTVIIIKNEYRKYKIIPFLKYNIYKIYKDKNPIL